MAGSSTRKKTKEAPKKPKKTCNPNRKGRRLLQYTEERMAKAIQDVRSGGHSCSNSIDEDHDTSFDEEIDILNEQADMASDVTPDDIDTDDDEEPSPSPSDSAAPVPSPSGSAAPAPKRARLN
ncbi:hypothetical protein GE061_013654 [Apolygus lucorum]|uniref:Uncharacterized protein n=1 Tax=Apolygus lucorum TaxID=248454 RepID=A0A8S9XQN1_APOLU|nr:hypothetical protein GE061_013654 [Apolygus lucorum]